MTFRIAVQVLLESAKRDLGGAGCGIRSIPSDAAAAEIREAARIVWLRACGKEIPPPAWVERSFS